jgi:hypothetical protein
VGGATRAFYLEVLGEGLGLIGDSGADHLVIGGIAEQVHFGRPLNPSEDIDVLIRLADAEPLLDRFTERGYTTYRRDESWIFKAARPDVTIDLIFRAGETIELDDEHLDRSRVAHRDGVSLRVPAPEDLAVMKAVFDAPDRNGNWYTAIEILRRLPIDWDYLGDRAARHAPRRVLSLLLYAADLGVHVPERLVGRLLDASRAGDARAGASPTAAGRGLTRPTRR